MQNEAEQISKDYSAPKMPFFSLLYYFYVIAKHINSTVTAQIAYCSKVAVIIIPWLIQLLVCSWVLAHSDNVYPYASLHWLCSQTKTVSDFHSIILTWNTLLVVNHIIKRNQREKLPELSWSCSKQLADSSHTHMGMSVVCWVGPDISHQFSLHTQAAALITAVK